MEALLSASTGTAFCSGSFGDDTTVIGGFFKTFLSSLTRLTRRRIAGESAGRHRNSDRKRRRTSFGLQHSPYQRATFPRSLGAKRTVKMTCIPKNFQPFHFGKERRPAKLHYGGNEVMASRKSAGKSGKAGKVATVAHRWR
uniref:Putative secreted protein n=1 Tax=Ixodes ricinus TaxID=34613 RepID=A0A6B0UT76_IXORI